MGGYAPPPAELTETAAQAQARAGAAVDFRGTYGGPSGAAAQQWQSMQNAQQARDRNQQVPLTRREQGIADQREMEATGGGMGFQHTAAYNEAHGLSGPGVELPPTRNEIIDTYIASRPRYVEPSEIGDTKTQKAATGLQMLHRVTGRGEMSREAALGVVLEGQRQVASGTPGTRDERFYKDQLDLWNARYIEMSAGEHAFGKASGVPQPANRFENVGDIALAFEKAGNVKDEISRNYVFNPNVANVMHVLPHRIHPDGSMTPVGLQEYSWMGAVARERGLSEPGAVSFMPAIDFINTQVGRQGVYGDLAGGVKDTYTPLPAGHEHGGVIGVQPAAMAGVREPVPGAPGVYFTGAISKVEKPSGTSQYVYRTDPLAVALEGAAFLGDTLTFGLWKPGSAQLTKHGQNVNPALDTFNRELITVQSRKPEYDILGSQIASDKATLNAMLAGKLNAEGKFVGTPEEYTKYQELYSRVSANTARYNEYNAQVQSTLTRGFSSGAIISTGTGQYIVNPVNVKEYGAFSDWSAGAGQWIQRALGQKPATAAQFAIYEQTPEFKNAGPIMQIGEGGYKILATDPASIASSFLHGVEIYAGFGLVSAGFATAGASTSGTLSTVGKGGQYVLNSRMFQYGLGLTLVGATAWEASGGGTYSPSQTYSNIGSSAIHMTAMGWGAFAPEGIAKVGTPVARYMDFQMRTFVDNVKAAPESSGRIQPPPKPDILTQKMMETYGTTEPSFYRDATVKNAMESGMMKTVQTGGKTDILSQKMMEVYGTTEPSFYRDATTKFASERNLEIAAIRRSSQKPDILTQKYNEVYREAPWEKGEISQVQAKTNMDWVQSQLKIPDIPRELSLVSTAARTGVEANLMMETYGTLTPRFAGMNEFYPEYGLSTLKISKSSALIKSVGITKPTLDFKLMDTGVKVSPKAEQAFEVGIQKGKFTLELQPEMQMEMKTEPTLRKTIYKEPINLNILTQSEMFPAVKEVVAAKPSVKYKELLQSGYDWNTARRMSLGTTKPALQSEPLLWVFENVKPIRSPFGKATYSPAMYLETRMYQEAHPEKLVVISPVSNLETGLDTMLGIKPSQDYARVFDITPAQKTKQSPAPAPAQDYSRIFDITPAPTPKELPKESPLIPVIPAILVPGLPNFNFGRDGGGGGGSSGFVTGFVFTEKLAVKTAREVMFGKTPPKTSSRSSKKKFSFW